MYYVQACNSEALTRTATNVRILTAFVLLLLLLLLLFEYLKILYVARSKESTGKRFFSVIRGTILF